MVRQHQDENRQRQIIVVQRALSTDREARFVRRDAGADRLQHAALVWHEIMRDIRRHDRADDRTEDEEGAATGEHAREREGEREKEDRDRYAPRRLAPWRLGELIIAKPADDEQHEHEQDRLPGLDRENGRIDQIEIGFREIDRDHQREAREPDEIGLPAEPADLRLGLGGNVHVARDPENAVVGRAPHIGFRGFQREIEPQETERETDPEDGGDDMQPAQEKFDPVESNRGDHSASLTRCCATGIIWRAFATRLGSTRAETTPTPSDAFATTWPQGSATSEWP